MHDTFCRSDYYGFSVPPVANSRQRTCPTTDLAGRGEGDNRWFPRSPCTGRRGRCPAMPLQHRHTYTAGIRCGLTTGTINQLRSHPSWGVRCNPAPIRQIRAGGTLEGLFTLVPCVHLPILLAGPTPSDSSGVSRRCRGCFPSLPALPDSDCPQLHRCAATHQRRSPFISARFHGASWRTMV